MDYLPFDPDAHATKADISLVRAEAAVFDANLRSEIAQLGGQLRAEMGQQTRTLVLALVTIEVTILLAVLGVVLAS